MYSIVGILTAPLVMFYSNEDGIPFHLKDHHVLADNIKVICELPKNAVPFWKIFPSQFVLYPYHELTTLMLIPISSFPSSISRSKWLSNLYKATFFNAIVVTLTQSDTTRVYLSVCLNSKKHV
jgi:hypothetical protein